VGHRLRVAEVVQRADVEVGAERVLRAEEVPPDAAEAVDADANGHPLLRCWVPRPGGESNRGRSPAPPASAGAGGSRPCSRAAPSVLRARSGKRSDAGVVARRPRALARAVLRDLRSLEEAGRPRAVDAPTGPCARDSRGRHWRADSPVTGYRPRPSAPLAPGPSPWRP